MPMMEQAPGYNMYQYDACNNASTTNMSSNMEEYQEVTPQISPFGFSRKTRGKGRGSNRPQIPMTQIDTSETNINSHMSTNSSSANAYDILNETAHQDVNYNPLSHLSTAECEDFLQNNSTNYGQPYT